MRIFHASLAVLLELWFTGFGLAAEVKLPVPEAKEIEQLLREKPISLDTWDFWRERHIAWYYDNSSKTEKFDEQITEFVGRLAAANNNTLPDRLINDAVAWSQLGLAYVQLKEFKWQPDRLLRAEKACRKAIHLDEKYPGGHSGLAVVLALQVIDEGTTLLTADNNPRLDECQREINNYAGLSPNAHPAWIRGWYAIARRQYTEAEEHLREAMGDFPHSESAAILYSRAVLLNENREGGWSPATAPLVERFPQCGRLHHAHAMALLAEGEGPPAVKQLEEARRLGMPIEDMGGQETYEHMLLVARTMTPALHKGIQALNAHRYEEAVRCFQKALEEQPEATAARWLALAMISRIRDQKSHQKLAAAIEQLCQRFPTEGALQAYYAVALAYEQRFVEAAKALDRAQELGSDPAGLIGTETVDTIRKEAAPTWLEQFLYVIGGVAAFYAVVILFMALAGVVLAAWSPTYRAREAGASLLDTADADHAPIGWVYITILMIGLLLFYVAVPFVAIGLAGATAGVLYLILCMHVISVHLIVVVAVIGFGMALAVLKSLFAAPNRKHFGIKKTEAESPRLHAALREVAAKLQTDPVEEVYVNPGSAIAVWQEGRGPFGVFGTKRRVLTLGLSTLHYLTISELKAILAHEYAHFSHHDTAYGRFIHQVTLSTGQSLSNMAFSLGRLNYINPFFWFFWLYHRAYMMLAAGFARSREFLADRRAASLYGKDAFVSGLVKVSTDGTLFESTIYHNIASLLGEGKAFVNMYEAFHNFRDQGLKPEEREKMYREMLVEKRSLFASHPSFHERVEAVSGFPAIDQDEPASAESLFEDLVAIEQELTSYLTFQVSAVRHVQWSAHSQTDERDDRLQTRPTYPEELPDSGNDGSGNDDSDSQTRASSKLIT